MITDEKPPLDDDLLMHFGIKGMKWGQRKSSSKSSGKKMSTGKKVAIGIGAGAAVVGAAAASYVLLRRGRNPTAGLNALGKAAAQIKKPDPSPAQLMAQVRGHQLQHFETRAFLAGKSAVFDTSTGRWGMKPSLAATQLRDAFPSQRKLFPVKPRLADSDSILRRANRDALKIARTNSNMDATTQKLIGGNQMSLAQIQRNLQDPNYVWKL